MRRSDTITPINQTSVNDSSTQESNHRELYMNCTGPPSANIFPYKFCSKTSSTFAEFNLSHPGGVISRDIVRKNTKELGLFYLQGKVTWNISPIHTDRKITDHIPTVDESSDKIICFFQQTNINTTKDYLSEQANMLIKKMKIISRGEIEGFSLYKSLCSIAEKQYTLIIEFPLMAGVTGERFIEDLIEFDQLALDMAVYFGIFQSA